MQVNEDILMDELHAKTSFSSTETSVLMPSYHSFFIQATDIAAHPNIINGNFISFLWMETGCKLGSPDKFENDKIYSNAITQQNERAWHCFGFMKEHDNKLGFLTICEQDNAGYLEIMHYNCSWFHQLKLQGTNVSFQEVNWKICRNSSLKILEHENTVLCTYHRNLFFNFNLFFMQLFWLFQWIYVWNNERKYISQRLNTTAIKY